MKPEEELPLPSTLLHDLVLSCLFLGLIGALLLIIAALFWSVLLFESCTELLQHCAGTPLELPGRVLVHDHQHGHG